MARVHDLRVHIREARVPQRLLHVKGEVLVRVRLRGLHEREDDGREVLDDGGQRVVVAHHEDAPGPEHSRRLCDHVWRPRRGMRSHG